MRIVITGNMGYVGPQVVAQLRSTRPDAEIVGIDTGFFAHCLTGAATLPESRLKLQRFLDVRQVQRQDIEGADAVILLAAISNDPMGSAYAEITREINYECCLRISKLAKEAGVGRVVFASSCSVYGFAEDGARTEDSTLNPLTAYAHSKIDTENALAPIADESFLVTCLRFPTACGMSPRLRLDLVLNDFVASAVATGRIEILSDGTPYRPLIDTKDMALAIDWALGRRADQGGAFLAINAGSNEANYQIRDLAERVRAVLPDVSVSVNEQAAPDKRSYRVDFSKYRSLAPDHQPRVPLETSIRELVQGLEAMEFADASFRESGLIRLKALGKLRESGRLNENLEWTR